MGTSTYAALLSTLFNELVHGSPDASARTYVLNQGDGGLLASLRSSLGRCRLGEP